MALNIYNSLNREIEAFKPLDQTGKTVGLYTCGPTVYNYPHIGNYRAYVFGDILKRTLLYNGFEVKHIMNLTDIDDKTIRDSQKAGKSLKEFTEFYTEEFYKDRDALNIIPAAKYTKATDYVGEMVAITEKLMERGYAYKGEDGSIYFSLKKDSEYGKLSHIDVKTLEDNASGRMRADEYNKEDAQDFALWKAWDAADGDVFWETKLGKGRPGWHIECSAMSMSELGESFDLHTGGIDNMFPHHENEIAQSECATGKQFVKYWMHNEWLLVDGKKMAKSAGNFYTLRDVIDRGHNPLAYRYLLLGTHYRTPVNFSWDALKAAETGLTGLFQFYRLLGDVSYSSLDISKEYQAKFLDAVNNDLNTSQALAIVSEVRHDQALLPATKKATLIDFDRVLGLDLHKLDTVAPIPETIRALIAKRDEARATKNWPASDELRTKLQDSGYDVYDTPEGTVVILKNS
jgi:cysteinyl-tRNA synthetase